MVEIQYRVQKISIENIESTDLDNWITEFDQYLKKVLPNYVCFIHSHGAYPQKELPEGITLLAKGGRSFFIFGNRNQFYKVAKNIPLLSAMDAVGAYGSVRLYIVAEDDQEILVSAGRKRKIGFYSNSENIDAPSLNKVEKLNRGFIEIETWLEFNPDGNGGEWTFLKVFKTDNIPQFPDIPNSNTKSSEKLAERDQ